MTILTTDGAKQWMFSIKERMEKNIDQLTALDQAIGDGDHGLNMVRGFTEVSGKINNVTYGSVSDVLKSAAMTLSAKVGGASGPLYGTAFLAMSVVFQDKEVDQQVLKQGIVEAAESIKKRGNVELGDKTMYDVWFQVGEVLDSEIEDWNDVAEVCQAMIEDTRELEASKGRASYLGNQSKGHVDPGSMSSFYIFEALVEVLKGEKL
ncbi:dihydroxyacetone kinase-like protein [Gracilibacillus halotolerans]|uniref:phosphoenolpyruvate--glycerone phosphotransferase n=1 Tax=Gracilibacillus halotolerans TaxID=74386 RepID=A0A841RI96_9BACI|nr:dihydroxyacetone kinase subunit DhaL [Gracilibacillus halotolerans]MBB6512199.1 dihydroxyacetone kinase-like protein [Gracilibacillus halotolerans]